MSSYGQGSIAISPRSVTGGVPGPPFAANSADNGLSVDAISGRIVLGDDIGGVLAAFLSDREIEMAGFLFQMIDSGGTEFLVNPTLGQYRLGGNTFDYRLLIDATNQNISLANNGTGLAGNGLLFDYLNNEFTIGSKTNTGLLIEETFNWLRVQNQGVELFFDGGSKYVQLGIGGSVNDPYIAIDEFTNNILFDNITNTVTISVNGQPGFTGTVTPVNSITVEQGLVTAVT